MSTLAVSFALAALAAFVVGLLFGARLGSSAARQREEAAASAERKIAETRDAELRVQLDAANREIAQLRPLAIELATANERVRSEQAKYEQMKADLDTAFGDLAARALSANNQTFLTLAKQELGGQATLADKALAARQQAIQELVSPLKESLGNLDKKTQEMEQARAGAYSEVKTLVESMQKSIPASLDSLRIETSQLVSALRAPKTRGNWGELQLKRCVEYAGMVQYCSFTEQVSARDEDSSLLRPDLIVRLPNGREIVVDAKTPLDAFLDGSGATDPVALKMRFDAHAQRVRSHLKALASKSYWKQFDKAPDFVVCFLPSEALFSAALEADPSLIEFGAENQVVMATPTTLIALLRAVEFGWQQTEITKNAKAIHELGRRIYEKLVVAQGHVTKLGAALERSAEAYNQFLGSIEGRKGGSVFALGRQLGELTHAAGELEEVEGLKPAMRSLESPEWAQSELALTTGKHDRGGSE